MDWTTTIIIAAVAAVVSGIVCFILGSAHRKKTAEGLIGSANEEATRIVNQAVTEAETVVDYNVGDAVKITDGPFAGFDGTVEEIVEDRSKLKVMVMIFGRKTLLELNFTQVTKE